MWRAYEPGLGFLEVWPSRTSSWPLPEWAFRPDVSISLWSQTHGTHLPSCRRLEASPSLRTRSEEHTSELQSRLHLVCRLLLEKKKKKKKQSLHITKKNTTYH